MKTKLKNKLFYAVFIFCVLVTQNIIAQNCSVNAGGDIIVCDNSTTLQGSRTANFNGNPSWSLLSFTPVPGASSSTASVNIVSPNSLVTDVTGLNNSGDYVFQITQPCTSGGNSVSTVTITAYNSGGFTAGADVSGVCSSVGTTDLTDAIVPPGFTASWSIENIFRRERLSDFNNDTNAQFDNANIPNPTFSLINKNNHDIDPAYDLTLTITSLDGSCTFTDTKRVTFCPNPNISISNLVIQCSNLSGQEQTSLSGTPFFSDSPEAPNSAGNGSLTLNVISQPSGANMSLNRLETSTLLYDGMTEIGVYSYTITVNTCCGNFTTPTRTIEIQNIRPSAPNFDLSAYPDQLDGYLGSSGENRAGEVKCNLEGTSNIECFYFDIDPNDDANIPISVSTTAFSGPAIPPGASAPSYTVTRGIGGNARRVQVCVDPGASGWLSGTYTTRIVLGTTCTNRSVYKIHISDSNRVDLAVADQTICTNNTQSETAVINLPPNFLTPASNPSYFNEYGSTLSYNFTVISKPSGSSNPVFSAVTDRQLQDATTTISNLDGLGVYTFEMSIFNGNGSGDYMQEEYACSGASPVTQFTITVEPIQDANAGSSQSFSCSSETNLVGNVPTGSNTGDWQLVGKPSGASDPVIGSPNAALTNVDGFDTTGTYTFSWNITSVTGNCTDSDQVAVTILNLSPQIDNIIVTDIVNGNDGALDIVASGGSGSLTYSISSGGFSDSNTTGDFNNLAPGVYDVVVNDGTCPSNTLQVEILADECDPVSGNPDTDGDGVTDVCDLDDDNDGITDEVESCSLNAGQVNIITNGSFENNNYNGFEFIYPDTDMAGWNNNVENAIQINDFVFTDGKYSITLNQGSTSQINQELNGISAGDQLFYSLDIARSSSGNLATTVNVKFGPTVAGAVTNGQFSNTTNFAFSTYSGTYEVPAGQNTTFIVIEVSNSRNYVVDNVVLSIGELLCADTDNDGIPDNLDLDSDNDGIPDLVEAGGVDNNNDGVVDGTFADTDGDGWSDTFDADNGGTALPDTNSDADSLPNRLDLDADDDGIPDNIEGQTTQGYIAPSLADTTTDFETNRGFYTSYVGGFTPVDTDGDTTPDYLDGDSDDDGLTDLVESFVIQPGGVVGTNGLLADAETADDYTDVNGLAYELGNFDLADTDGDMSADGSNASPMDTDFDYRDDNSCISLNLKVYLAGALIDNGGATGSNNEPLMRDNLRSSAITGQIGNNVIPALEPYTALAGFTHVGSGGGRSATATAFDDRGQNSVVDWVFIEFRDKNDNTTVLETMSALVQRDGDVVDIDGVSPIQLCTTETEYFVAVRHRNHLGVMTALAEDLKLDNTVDFSDNNAGGSGVFNYGTSHPVGGLAGFDYTGLSQQSAFNFAPLPGGVNALWAGNSSGDDKIKFESPDDDLNTMLFSVLLFPGNSSFQPSFDFALTYDVGDLDMNGKVKFESPDDDQNFLLFQVLLHPLNNTFQSSFDFIFEQLP